MLNWNLQEDGKLPELSVENSQHTGYGERVWLESKSVVVISREGRVGITYLYSDDRMLNWGEPTADGYTPLNEMVAWCYLEDILASFKEYKAERTK